MSAIGVVVFSIVILTVMLEAGAREHQEKIEQRPMLYGLFRNTDRELGEPCQYSFDCSSGCCLKSKSGKWHCSRKAKKGELCSGGQIKLDMYMGHCPCEKGISYCSDGDGPRCLA